MLRNTIIQSCKAKNSSCTHEKSSGAQTTTDIKNRTPWILRVANMKTQSCNHENSESQPWKPRVAIMKAQSCNNESSELQQWKLRAATIKTMFETMKKKTVCIRTSRVVWVGTEEFHFSKKWIYVEQLQSCKTRTQSGVIHSSKFILFCFQLWVATGVLHSETQSCMFEHSSYEIANSSFELHSSDSDTRNWACDRQNSSFEHKLNNNQWFDQPSNSIIKLSTALFLSRTSFAHLTPLRFVRQLRCKNIENAEHWGLDLRTKFAERREAKSDAWPAFVALHLL